MVNVILTSFLFSFLFINISFATNISFIDIFPKDFEQKEEVLKEVNDWIDNINEAKPNNLYLKLKHNPNAISTNEEISYDNLFEVRLKDSTNGGVFFQIDSQYCVSLDQIQHLEEWETIYKLIKKQKDILAVYLLSQILNEGHYFYKLYPNKIPSPYGYDYEVFDILKVDDIYDSLKTKYSTLKESYKDLRRLLYSYNEEFRSNFLGQFLFIDFLWAHYIIDTLGHVINGKTYIIPTLDYIKLQGIREDKQNTRLSYNISMHENKIVVKAIGSNYDIENSFMLNYSNLEYYSEYGMLPIKNSYEHITINLLELFKEDINETQTYKLHLESESLAFLSKFKIFVYQSNENLFVFLKMLSLKNKEVVASYVDNLNPNNFEDFHNDLSNYNNVDSDILLEKSKIILNYLIGKINSIHQSIVFNNYDELDKNIENITEEELGSINTLKEFIEKYSSEIITIKSYLQSRLNLFEDIFHQLVETYTSEAEAINSKKTELRDEL